MKWLIFYSMSQRIHNNFVNKKDKKLKYFVMKIPSAKRQDNNSRILAYPKSVSFRNYTYKNKQISSKNKLKPMKR